MIKRIVPSVLHPQLPLRHVCLAPPFHKLATEPAPNSVPSMMSVGEQAFIYNLAKQFWRGEGIIIDAGLMCGASTFLFGKAIEGKASHRKHDVIAIDMAVADPGAIRFIRKNVPDFALELGDDFSPLIRRFIGAVQGRVDLRIGNICSVGKSEEPVEILYFDVIKTQEVSDFVFENYVPLLLRDGFIIQQDYFCDLLPWIRENQEALDVTGATRYLGEIGPMAVFRVAKLLSKAEYMNVFAPKTYDQSVVLLSRAEQRSMDPCRRLLCALSRVWRAAQMTDPDHARHVMRSVRDSYAGQIHANNSLRISNALKAAEYLCDHEWDEAASRRAALIAVGHTYDDADRLHLA